VPLLHLVIVAVQMNLRHHQVEPTLRPCLVDLLVDLLVVPYPYLVLIALVVFQVRLLVPFLPVVLAHVSVLT
jgi:hypothetical protein